MERRRFISRAAGAALGLGLAGAPLVAKPGKASVLAGDVPAPPRVTLGNTGIVTTRMAQGTGTSGVQMQSNQVRAGFGDFVALMRHAYDRGVRFFDLADQYGSHVYMREALKSMDRSEVTLLTKFQYRWDGRQAAIELPQADQKRSMRKALDRFRLELDVDVLDIVLMHNVVNSNWDGELAGYIEGLREAKERGIVKALGMSCHTLEALERASELDWIELALTRINPFGTLMDGSVEDVVPVQRRFKERGASVMGMKIFGAGRHVDAREKCMEFAQNLGYLDSMTIGAEKPEHVDQNLRLMAQFPAR